MNSILELQHIGRTFTKGKTKLAVLTDVNLIIYPGQLIALTGPSGSGKSTLLHIAGLLDTPTNGTLILDGQNLKKMSDLKRTALRRHHIGFIYQSHLLLPDFSALENVMLPQRLAGASIKEAQTRAEELLTLVGLEKRLHHRSGQLSGGEQQRVAIARALANKPKLLLADEPTGNLDPVTAESVFNLLLKIVRDTGLAAVIATHNPDLANRMDMRLTIKDGALVIA